MQYNPKKFVVEVAPQNFLSYFTFVITVRKGKLPCLIVSPHKLHLMVKTSFPSNFPAYSNFVVLVEN